MTSMPIIFHDETRLSRWKVSCNVIPSPSVSQCYKRDKTPQIFHGTSSDFAMQISRYCLYRNTGQTCSTNRAHWGAYTVHTNIFLDMTINYSLKVVETETIILAVFRVVSPNYRYLNTMLTVPSKYEFSSRQLAIKDTLRQHLIVSKNPSENLILIPKSTCKF